MIDRPYYTMIKKNFIPNLGTRRIFYADKNPINRQNSIISDRIVQQCWKKENTHIKLLSQRIKFLNVERWPQCFYRHQFLNPLCAAHQRDFYSHERIPSGEKNPEFSWGRCWHSLIATAVMRQWNSSEYLPRGMK